VGGEPLATSDLVRSTDPSGAPFEFRVQVRSLAENRSTVPGRGAIPLSNAWLLVTRDGLPVNARFRGITLKSIADERGRPVSFIPTKSAAGGLSWSSSSGFRPSELWVTLMPFFSPSREARALTFESEVEFHFPTEAAGTLVRLPNPASHPGRVESPLLARRGVMAYLYFNQKTYDDLREDLDYPNPPRGTAGRWGVDGQRPDFLGLIVHDPSGLLSSWEIVTKDDQLVSGGQSRHNLGPPGSPLDIQQFLLEPLPADAELRIYLAPPESLRTVPFRIENVKLF
jgi:hypothetical protein